MGDDEGNFQKLLSGVISFVFKLFLKKIKKRRREVREREKEEKRKGSNILAGTIMIFLKKVRKLENCQVPPKYIVSLKHAQKCRVSLAIFIKYVPLESTWHVMHSILHTLHSGLRWRAWERENLRLTYLKGRIRNVGKEMKELSSYCIKRINRNTVLPSMFPSMFFSHFIIVR